MPIARWQGELDAIVGEHRVDFVGHRNDQGFEEGCGRPAVRSAHEFDEGKFAGSVYGNIEMQLAFRGMNFGQIDVEVADWIALEFPFCGLVALDIRQPADPMPLQTSMQRRPGQMRDRRLQRVKTIIQRQERMPPESHDDCLFVFAQNS